MVSDARQPPSVVPAHLLDDLRLHVLPTLGSVQLNKLDKAMLRVWMAELTASHLKPGTVHQVYRALRRVLGAAVKNDILVRSPLDGIKPPRVERQEMRFLEPGAVALLADSIGARYRAFVTVGAYCGLRLSELAGLRRHRVDLLHRHLLVVEQLGRDEGGRWALQPLKTRSSVRSVALPAMVVDSLAVVPLDTRDFRGMDAQTASSRRGGNQL